MNHAVSKKEPVGRTIAFGSSLLMASISSFRWETDIQSGSGQGYSSSSFSVDAAARGREETSLYVQNSFSAVFQGMPHMSVPPEAKPDGPENSGGPV